jgi:hypothetical protein
VSFIISCISKRVADRNNQVTHTITETEEAPEIEIETVHSTSTVFAERELPSRRRSERNLDNALDQSLIARAGTARVPVAVACTAYILRTAGTRD